MKAPCRKCGKMFERATRYCKICDKCWTLSRKAGPKNPFPGYKACPICSKLIYPAEKRMHLVGQEPPSKLVFHNSKDTQLGLYHLGCWNRVIAPKIQRLLNADKKLTLNNHLFQSSENKK